MKWTSILSAVAFCALVSGCRSEPSNPLLGSWTSTTPAAAIGAAGCPSHYTFKEKSQTDITAGQESTIMVSYSVQPDIVFVVMQTGSNGYKILGPNSVAWSMGPCTYKRD